MNSKPLRVVYAGTPEFAVPALRSLAASEHQLVAVYTQPDRPSGRGRKLVPGPVKQAAMELGIAVEQPLSLKDSATHQRLRDYRADLMVVAAYGLLLPQVVLDIPRLGCINIHASLLPRWRGAAPIQRAIEAGDSESGVTIMQMAAGLDTGDMLLRTSCPIGVNTTGSELHDSLADLGARSLMNVISLVGTPNLKHEAQNESLATYANKLSKSEATINWELPSVVIHRRICAFNGWPVAQTVYAGDTLRVWQSRLTEGGISGSDPGLVVDTSEGLDVATGDGVLRIVQVQVAGKKPVSALDFIRSRQVASGSRLG